MGYNTSFTGSSPYVTELDYAGGSNLTYFGQAVPGTLTSASIWRIAKLTYDGSNNLISMAWAASGAFQSVWDNRASLSYS